MPPNIFLEGDKDAARSLIPKAQQLLGTVRARALTSGASVMGQHMTVDERTVMYALRVGEQEIISISVIPDAPPVLDLLPPGDQLPDFLSGLLKSPVIRAVESKDPGTGDPIVTQYLDSFKPARATADYYAEVAAKSGQANKVPAGWNWNKRLAVTPHKSLPQRRSLNPKITYSQYSIRASMYSGRMQKLAQVVLGYGRLPASTLGGMDRARRETVAAEGLQLIYDFRFYRTHGVYKDDSGQDWLVEISSTRGILARKLPVFKDSYERLKDSDRSDIATAVEEFHGLPTGEGIPFGPALEAGLKAGTIVRVCEASVLTPFYQHQPMGSTMGWCFNERGDEAHNVGWRYGEDAMKRSAHYVIQMSISTTKDEEGKETSRGQASLAKVREGKLYNPNAKTPPPLKFYEPTVNALLSVWMLADTDNGRVPPEKVGVCDAPVHVSYIDGTLEVLNYFWDSSGVNIPTVHEDNFEECMYIGAWQSSDVRKPEVGPATFYSARYDFRAPYAESSTVHTITSSDLGGWFYVWGDDPSRSPIPCWATVSRYRAYRRVSTIKSFTGAGEVAAVVVPGFIRNGYAIARIRSTTSETLSTGVDYLALSDPTSYSLWRNFYRRKNDTCYDDVRRRIGPAERGEPSQCQADLTDHGDWLNACQSGEFPMGGTPAPTSKFTVKKGSTKLDVYLLTGSGFGALKLPTPDNGTNYEGPVYMWTHPSPDLETGNYQVMDCMHNCFGSDAIVYAETINGPMALRGGPLGDAVPNTYYSFIGVID